MKTLIVGNEAVALGALQAGMTFFVAYPITPASEIMHVLARKEGEIAFVHAEDNGEVFIFGRSADDHFPCPAFFDMNARSGFSFSPV